jgi:hypothetical protein
MLPSINRGELTKIRAVQAVRRAVDALFEPLRVTWRYSIATRTGAAASARFAAGIAIDLRGILGCLSKTTVLTGGGQGVGKFRSIYRSSGRLRAFNCSTI